MENKHKNKEKALETLKWLHRHGYTLNEDSCTSASCFDNLEALKWARSCPWNEYTLSKTAGNGNMDILKYCLGSKCPMSSLTRRRAIEDKEQM